MGTNAPVDQIEELEKLPRVCFNSLVSGSYLVRFNLLIKVINIIIDRVAL